MKKTILFIPGFMCDTWTPIENYSIQLSDELKDDFEILWLVPSIDNPDNGFKYSNNKQKLTEPIYVTEAKKHNIKTVVANLSKINIFKTYSILKKIINDYNVDVIYLQFQYTYTVPICAKLLGKKVIYTLHSGLQGIKFRFLRKLLYKFFIDDFHAVSKFVARGLPRNKPVYLVYNAKPLVEEDFIDKERQNKHIYREKLNLTKFDYIITMIAAFRPEKQHDLAVKIAEKVIKNSYKNIGFVFLGQGDLYGQIEKEVLNKGISQNVIMPGHIQNIEEYLLASDLNMLTSAFEAFGICLIEAMSYKLPTLSFALPSAEEIITDGEDGCFIPINDVEKYAQKILSLLDNQEERTRLGENAYQTVKNRFSIEAWRENMKTAFHKILG